MKKIIFLLLLTTTIFAQRIWQFPDADTTLSTSLQKNSLIILNQDPTGLGGLNYITRKLKFESLGAVIAKGDTTFVFKNKVNRFTENNYFSDNWFFSTDNSELGTPTFSSGFSGSGFKIYKSENVPEQTTIKGRFNNGGWTGEFDNISVRGTAFFNKLQVNETQYDNGNRWITNGAVVDSVYYIETTDIRYEDTSPIILEGGDTLQGFAFQAIVTFQDPSGLGIVPFRVGDLLLYQNYQPLKDNETRFLVKTIRATVRKVVNGKVTIDFDDSTVDIRADGRAIIEPGYNFVRVGSTVDPTRAGSIYFSINDLNSPKMIIYDSVASWTDWDSFAKTKVVLGKMIGITDPIFGDLGAKTTYGGYFPNGTLFARNVEIDGNVKILEGETLDSINANSVTANSALDTALTNSGKIFTDASGEIIKTPTTSGAGLYLGSTNLGFWNGSDWRTYMANNGNFFLTGSGSGGLSWNSSTSILAIAGQINILNPGDIFGSTINNNDGWTDDTAADAAQSTANSKILSFVQPTAPSTSNPEGSIWFDSDDLDTQYRLDSGVWAVKVGVGAGIGTLIDGSGIYTGTLVAGQVIAGTLDAGIVTVKSSQAGFPIDYEITSGGFTTKLTDGPHVGSPIASLGLTTFSILNLNRADTTISAPGIQIVSGDKADAGSPFIPPHIEIGNFGGETGYLSVDKILLDGLTLTATGTGLSIDSGLDLVGTLTSNSLIQTTASIITSSSIFEFGSSLSSRYAPISHLHITTDIFPYTVDGTEFGYVDGVTNPIQTQIDGKGAKSTATSYTVVTAVRTADHKTRLITINADGSITVGTESGWTSTPITP